MKLKSFDQLFNILLSDLSLIEEQNSKLFPKIVNKCSSNELKNSLQKHAKDVDQHRQRVKKIIQQEGGKIEKMEWESPIRQVFKAAETFIDENEPSPLLDAAIITLIQQIKHLEIALYGTLREYATITEKKELENLLRETLKEEKGTDSLLIKLARESGINVEAAKA